MKLVLRLLGLLSLLGIGAQSPVLAQCVSLTTAGSAVSQSFDTLANTGTTNNLTITGWFLTESGGGARDNEQYGADTGGSNTGDTYSYGGAAATDRALGGLQAGTLIPIFGACFTNNTGVTLTSLRVDYTGEQWRLGTISRTDQIDFQYSTNATSLVSGGWADVNALDFIAPFTATAGARDGNAAANRTALTHTIPALSIANGATFWIRWTDFNASGADDGLAVDDFSLTPGADPCAAVSFPYTLPNNAPATLITAITCANANGTADVIDLNGQTVALTASFADYDGATGLPRVDTPITLRNGTITRSGSNQFRLLQVGPTGNLIVRDMSLTNGGGATYPGMGGNLNANTGSVVTLINTVVNAAAVGNSFNAGGIFASGTFTMANCTVSGNIAGRGAGLALQNGPALITNSVISGNVATSILGGGAMYIVGLDVAIINSTITGNYATATGATRPGGILSDVSGANLTLQNSILWGNSNGNATDPQIVNDSAFGSNTVSNSIVQGGQFGGLNAAPLFTTPLTPSATPSTAGNFRLLDASPGIDAGANANVPADTLDVDGDTNLTEDARDLAGNPRRYDDTGVADTGSGTAPIVDMGAFEKQTVSPPVFPMDVDYCNLQFPTSFTAAAGSVPPLIYGRIFEDDNGVLTSSAGAHPSIVAEVGHGPLGSDPRGGNPAWQWLPATFNTQVGNDDEYQGSFTVPFAPTNTQRSYTYRFSVDSGASYTYCDSDGNGTNGGLSFSTGSLGTLTINPGGQPTISINDVALAEGNSGVTPFSFTISLNGPSLSAVTFDIATADNTATVANGDYVSNSQTAVVIPAGQTSTTFLVLVNRDTTFEPNETFFVNLTNVTGANVGDAQGTGTIVNDDVDPCAAYTFPYTMTGNTPAELIQAINCANLNGASADTINLNSQTVTLTESYTSAYGSGTGLPEITTAVVIQNGTITRSSADLFRFFIYSGSSSLTLNNITLSNGNPEWDGGAIWGMGSSTLIINNSRIIGNYGNYGGAIFIPSSGTAVITNTLLSGNRASSPGGAIRNRGNLTLNNSTIAANFTTAGTEGGGGIANNGGTVVLNNSIVHGNEASSFPATNDIRGTFTANNSLVGVNPSFVDLLDAGDTAPTTGGDYRLANFSLAIDSGDNSLIPGGVSTDLDGNPRRYNDTVVVDSGVGTAPIVDLGAYEKQTNSALPQADLGITKTNGTATSTPGGSTTYTIVASNAGPGDVGGATVADTFPASLTCTWTCVGAGGGTCTAAGAGNINDTVNLPSGGSVNYTASCAIIPSAAGSLVNTATVSSALTDPNPANNSATDSDTLSPQADVSITKTDGQTSVNAGSNTLYTITASNAGPSNAPAVTVADTFPAFCVSPSWTCAGAGGGSCAANGSGNINLSVNLPAGGSVSFSATCPINGSASGTLSNTATATAGVTDPSPGNNSATDTSTIVAAPVLSINSVGLTEGDSGSSNLEFTVTRSTTGTAFSVDYATADGGAAAGSDYTTTTGTMNFAADGAATQTINVPIIGDARVEGSESFMLTLSNPTGTAQIGTASGTGTITDNDSATVAFSPTTVSQSEATSPMAFTVTLSNPVQSGVTLTVNTANGTAMGADFTAISGGTVTFPANSTTAQTVSVIIANDALDEDDESFSLTLSGLTATGDVTLGTATATGTIVDDDATPTLSITSPSQNEGNAGTSTMDFIVSLSTPSGRDVSFTRATSDGSATAANNDYVAVASGNLSIPAGEISVSIPVTINGDAVFEGDENFSVDLTGITNATPVTLTGTGTILEDDQQPTTTTITADLPDPSVVGQSYPVSVSVAAQTLSPSGTVIISDGTASCGPVTLTAGTVPESTASCSLTSTSAGTKTLTASYTAATAAFGDSSGTSSHQVDPAATTISVSGPARSRINQPTSFSFALSVNAPGSGTPTGTVTLTSGAASCSATLPATSCNLTFSALGSRTVSASYAGDGNFVAANSSGPGNAQTLVDARSDLAVTKSDAVGTYAPGDLLVYTVTVRNLGPDAAANIRVGDSVPAGLTGVVWSCDASGGVVCPQANGSGMVDLTINAFPVGGLLNFTFFGNVDGSPAQIANTAMIALPADTTIQDPDSGNNSATDINLLDRLFQNGFEDAAVNAPAGGFRLPGLALRTALDQVAVNVYALNDAQGEALRVYARVIGGAVQYALATRDAQGRLRLAAWRSLDGDPTLSWTARQSIDGWVLQGAELR
jgi:uncharacterized repeat protein (TIGR01451 family)